MRKKRFFRDHEKSSIRGYTLMETVIAVGIIGVLAATFYPNFQGSIGKREMENEIRSIMLTMQKARVEAIRSKLQHRVRFVYQNGYWRYMLEQEATAGNWTAVPAFVDRIIPAGCNVTINLPEQAIIYNSLGLVEGYVATQNNVVLQSNTLVEDSIEDERTISIYVGGSTRISSAQSGG